MMFREMLLPSSGKCREGIWNFRPKGDGRSSVNGEVRGIYVFAGRSKCSVVIADWLVYIADVSGLGFDGDVFLVVEFSSLFFFSLFSCSIGFQMTGNLNDTPLMWCLFSSE